MNNRAEISHQPMWERERRTHLFKSPGPAQHFLAAYGLTSAHRETRCQRFDSWRVVTSTPAMP